MIAANCAAVIISPKTFIEYRCFLCFLTQISYSAIEIGINLTFTPNSYALNNKSFKTGPEVEPPSISNKIPKDKVS